MERERKDPSLRLLPVQPALTLYISFFSSWRFFLSFFLLFIPFSFLSRFLFLSSSLTIFSFFFSWATFLPSLGFGARTRSLFQIMNKRSFSAFLYRWLLYYYYAFCCEGGPFFTIVFDFFSLSRVALSLCLTTDIHTRHTTTTERWQGKKKSWPTSRLSGFFPRWCTLDISTCESSFFWMRVCRSDGLGYCFVQSLQQRQYKKPLQNKISTMENNEPRAKTNYAHDSKTQKNE